MRTMDPFRVLLLITVGSSVFLGTSARHGAGHGRGYDEHHPAEPEACPRGWKEKPYLCYEESHNEYDFANAFSYCLNQQLLNHWNGQFYGLISVGQLRHFKNRYPYAPEVDRHHQSFDHQRLFRVNARKLRSGTDTWHEYLAGKEVQFHHYPGFNPRSGRAGDTLIWDSKTDRLYTAGPQETFNVLCSTRRSDTCKDCPDAQWENECNNAGDCRDGSCFCDIGFKGYKCQVEPLEDSGLDLIVYAGDPSNPSQKYNLEVNVSCPVAAFPADVENLVSGQAFGHPMACGGNAINGSAIKQCWIYRYQSWLPELDMTVPRSNAAATVINDGRHDLIYWVTFGEDDSGNDLSSTEYLPWYGESWKSGPSVDAEYARKGHCAVQINYCEAALLGGVTNDTEFRDDILIFNFDDAKWKVGPRLKIDRAYHTCAVIKDPISDHSVVISACGFSKPYPLSDTGPDDGVEKWDLTTWETEILPWTCPTGVDYFDTAWAISDHEIIFTTGPAKKGKEAGEGIWSFTLDYGFRKINDWPSGKIGTGSALITKDYVDCL